nr:hypothetical protein [Nitrosomonas ureae]
MARHLTLRKNANARLSRALTAAQASAHRVNLAETAMDSASAPAVPTIAEILSGITMATEPATKLRALSN